VIAASEETKLLEKCLADFKERILQSFKNSGQRWTIDLGLEGSYPEAGIEDGYITFSNDQILSCFWPLVAGILELISAQIYAIQEQAKPLTASSPLILN